MKELLVVLAVLVFVVVFYGFLIRKYTRRDIGHRLIHGNPTWKDYFRTFVMLMTGQIAELKAECSFSHSPEKEINSVRYSVQTVSFAEKRKAGKVTSKGGVKVKGGLLPRQISFGTIQVYYDGSKPQSSRSKGGVRQYESSGNMQIFYKNKEDEMRTEFLGEIVDIYREY